MCSHLQHLLSQISSDHLHLNEHSPTPKSLLALSDPECMTVDNPAAPCLVKLLAVCQYEENCSCNAGSCVFAITVSLIWAEACPTVEAKTDHPLLNADTGSERKSSSDGTAREDVVDDGLKEPCEPKPEYLPIRMKPMSIKHKQQ